MKWMAIIIVIIALAIFFRMRSSVHRQVEQDKCPKCRRYEQAMRNLETTKQDVVEGVSSRQHPFRALVRELWGRPQPGLRRTECETCQQGGNQ